MGTLATVGSTTAKNLRKCGESGCRCLY